MKYKIDKELKSLEVFSGSMVGRLYPLINIGYGLVRCKSDSRVSVKKYSTPGYKGAKLSTLVIEPKQSSGNLPGIMFFHGGGFLMRASGPHYQIAKWYAEKANCKVVLTDYRLLPRYRYPVAVEDCYSTYLWTLKNADKLGINKDRIIVCGDSAGGNIATAVTSMLKDRNRPLPHGMILIYPVLDKRMKTGSMKRFTDTPIWDSRCNKIFWEVYLKGSDMSRTKYASLSELDSIDYFPQTYVEVAEFDCLHDEGIEFAERLRSEGIPVEVHDINGACHGYESAVKSSIVEKCMKRRLIWIKKVVE